MEQQTIPWRVDQTTKRNKGINFTAHIGSMQNVVVQIVTMHSETAGCRRGQM